MTIPLPLIAFINNNLSTWTMLLFYYGFFSFFGWRLSCERRVTRVERELYRSPLSCPSLRRRDKYLGVE